MPAAREKTAPTPIKRERLGRYELVGVLGRGGGAEVFLSLTEGKAGGRKLVVVKRLLQTLEDDETQVAQFLDEAKLAIGFAHPNIVTTFEVGTDRGRHFIAMSYLEGLTVEQLVHLAEEHACKIPPLVAVRILLDVVEGLSYAHNYSEGGVELRIVHRDVSPSNLFVCWTGATRVLDFGIAKATGRAGNTDSGVIKGKWGYIAPEQANGGVVDGRTDIWAAGVVLWELLSGCRLFPEQNDAATLSELSRGLTVPRLSNVDPVLRGIVARATSAQPADRHATAQEFADELAGYLRSHRRDVVSVEEWLYQSFSAERESQRAAVAACVSDVDLRTGVTERFALPIAVRAGATVERTRSSLPIAPIALGIFGTLSLLVLLFQFRAETPPPEPPAAVDSRATLQRTASAVFEPDAHIVEVIRESPTTQPDAGVAITTPVTLPRRRRELASRTPETPAAPATVEPLPRAEVPSGYLTLNTTPWTRVSFRGRLLGTTPLHRIELPEGRHDLLLRNDEAGIEQNYLVEITAGQVATRNVRLLRRSQ